MSDEELITALRANALWVTTHDAADRIEALEAKLAKAVEALEQIQAHEEKDWVTLSGKAPPDVQDLCDIARAALKGESHD